MSRWTSKWNSWGKNKYAIVNEKGKIIKKFRNKRTAQEMKFEGEKIIKLDDSNVV